MALFHLLKIRTSIDIFKNEKCKVTFGLEYIYIRLTKLMHFFLKKYSDQEMLIKQIKLCLFQLSAKFSNSGFYQHFFIMCCRCLLC